MRKAIVIFLMLGFYGIVQAQTNSESPLVIKVYIDALASKEQNKIDAAWEKLNADPQAVEYLKQNSQRFYRAYRLNLIAHRLQEMAAKLGTGSASAPITETTTNTVGTQGNQSFTRNSPNQAAVSNSKTAHDSINQNAKPNTTSTVRDSASNNSENTQDYLRHAR